MKIRTSFVSNSSSSSFVCDTKMDLTEVRRDLFKMLDFYNDLYKTKMEFEEVFCDPRIGTKKDDSYLQNDYGFPESAKGKILIESTSDNSIPYELFELIENRFDARRCHLG